MNVSLVSTTDEYVPLGLGWRQDLPDPRDFSPHSQQIYQLWEGLPVAPRELPPSIDLREYFPPVYNQAGLQSSTAQACAGLVEYFEGRSQGRFVTPSRLFLYKLMRRLLGISGDAGAELRAGFKAIRQFGLPPERFWPYFPERFDEEPDAFLYAFADRFRGIKYLRIDGRNTTGPENLQLVRAFLSAGFPIAFGFPVPSSISLDSDIPFYPDSDSFLGGQAVIAVGYDDRRLRNSRGAILIRNSWGQRWGELGYGWLPYRYVEQRLAADFWTLIQADWLQSEEFVRPHLDPVS